MPKMAKLHSCAVGKYSLFSDKRDPLKTTKFPEEEQKYFGGEAMVGNKVHLGYESFRRGDDTLVQCFNDEPELKQKFTRIYEILAAIDTFFSNPSPTEE